MILRDVIVVGAGPAGLATAIAAAKSGLSCQVIEKGALVNSLLHYPIEMVFFTTPELMEIGGMPFVSPYDKPTRLEALRYYRRVSDAYTLDVVFDEAVVAMTRDAAVPDADGSLVVDTRSARGVRRSVHGRTVVVATGAYDFPNRLGVPGEDLPHVSHYYTQPHPFFRKKVVIVGGKNSAAEAALDLFRAGAKVTIVHRGAAMGDSIKYWVKPDIDNRIKEGSIPARFGTPRGRDSSDDRRRRARGRDRRNRGRRRIPADRIRRGHDPAANRGHRDRRRHLRPGLRRRDLRDQRARRLHSGAMVAGVQSGRIFIENGRFHGQKAIDAIATGWT